MSEYQIDRDIVMPSTTRNHNFPFLELDVGESFYVGPEKQITKAQLHGSASGYGKRNNKKFAVRKWENGLRVWRIA